MKVRVNELKELIENVVLPISKEFEDSKEGKKILNTSKKQLNQRHLFAYLAITLLTKPELAKERFKEAIQTNEKDIFLDLNKNDLQHLLDDFFKLLKTYACNLIEKRLDYYHNEFLNQIKDEEEFFEFDDDFLIEHKSNLNHEEKISAEEFMAVADIDEDIILDIEELLEEYFHLSLKLDIEYIDYFLELFKKFAFLFELTCEFKTIAQGLYELINFLKDLNINFLSEDEKTLLKNFLDAIADDLNKWFNEIIIKKSATDIHYLDASLLSSIEQLKIFFRVSKENIKA